MNAIIDYLKQASTWRGIITIVAAFGVVINPEQVEAIVAAGIAAIGVIEVFRNGKNPS